jgi:hypothetical protein
MSGVERRRRNAAYINEQVWLARHKICHGKHGFFPEILPNSQRPYEEGIGWNKCSGHTNGVDRAVSRRED